MTYLLDTNTCIALIRQRPTLVRQRLDEALAQGARVALPTVALFELWFGVARSAPEWRDRNRTRLQRFATAPFSVLPFDDGDARQAGEILQTLRTRGTPIGPYDVLIAAQAVSRSLTLVTSSTGEFRRVDGLACVDWAAS